MLNLPHQSYVTWRACATVFHVVAILSTLVRIRTRYQSRQMWLDDYLVIIPTGVDLLYCLSLWVFPWLSPAGPYGLRKLWIILLVFYIVIWFSRICFMLSLARIFPPGNPTRSFILSLVFLFTLFFCSIVLLLALHCDPYNNSARHCVKLRHNEPVTRYTSSIDIISDIIMMVTPLAVLWKVKLPKLEKRVILVALSGSIITLPLFGTLMFFSFGPFVAGTLPYTIVTSMVFNLAAAASLLSCNALVVVTSLFRLYRRRGADAGGPETTSSNSSSPTGHAPRSALVFSLETTKEDANDRSPQSSYDFNLDRTSEGVADSQGSAGSFPIYILTQITMDDYDSRYASPPDPANWRFRPSEACVSSTRIASEPDHQA